MGYCAVGLRCPCKLLAETKLKPKLMKITSQIVDMGKLISSPVHAGYVRGGDQARSKGLHLSGVLQEIGKQGGVIEEYEEGVENAANARMSVGLAWEEWLMQRIPSISGTHWQPGEMSVMAAGGNNLYMTPDGYTESLLWPGSGLKMFCVLEECKATWKSTKREIEREWYWLNQVKGYCHALGLRKARLWVLHLNGKYEKGVIGDPVQMCHWIEWDENDIDAYWRMVCGYIRDTKPNLR